CVALNTCQRQSVERESYHTARSVPRRSISSCGRWLIAAASRPTLTGAAQTAPSTDVLARSERLTPELLSSRVSHATVRWPSASAPTLGWRSEAWSFALTRPGACHCLE